MAEHTQEEWGVENSDHSGLDCKVKDAAYGPEKRRQHPTEVLRSKHRFPLTGHGLAESLLRILAKHDPLLDLLEAELVIKPHRGCVVGHGLNLDAGDALSG